MKRVHIHTGLVVAIISPLIVLVVIAVIGTRAQFQAVRAAAITEAEQFIELSADEINLKLQQAVQTARLYEDPPRPSGGSLSSQTFDDLDLDGLRSVRDNMNRKFSASGLPIQVIAGLRVWQISGQEADAERLQFLASEQFPSFITEQVLKRLKADRLNGPYWQKWLKDEMVRSATAEGLETGSWVVEAGGVLWLHKNEDSISYLEVEKLGKIIDFQSRGIPAGMGMRISPEATARDGEQVLASSELGKSSGMFLHMFVADRKQIEGAARAQAYWTFTLLGLSVLTVGIALAVLMRSLSRERLLGEMKSQFVASVSHELRSPIGSIRLMADSLSSKRTDSATAEEFHSLISAEGARLSHLIENVLDFARIEKGQKLYQFHETALDEVVHDVCRVIRPQAEAREVELRLMIVEVTAEVDPHAVFQAVLNLVDNAVKFSPAGSEVTVWLKETPRGFCQLEVADQGSGILPKEMDRIFERFRRLGNELRRETQGSGIGLSLVKHIAEGHGGTIKVKSNPGGGCCFILCLPLTSQLRTYIKHS